MPLGRILSQDSQLWIPVCVNHPMEAMFYLENYPTKFDGVLMVEQDKMEEELDGFSKYIEMIAQRYPMKNILTITRNKKLFENFRQKEIRNLICEFIDDFKISPSEIVEFLKKHGKETEMIKKGFGLSFKKGLLKGEKNHLDFLTRANNVRAALMKNSKMIAFTGHSGVGVTSTAADLAYMASHMGIRTFLLDLDFLGRGVNLYYTKFGEEVDGNRQIEDSVLRGLKNPHEFEKFSCRINENLFISTLAYSYKISTKEMQGLMEGKNGSMFSHILKERANLVILDAPKSSIQIFEGLSSYVDTIGVCVNNSTYSLINTSKMLLDYGKEDPLFLRKIKVVGTKFNQLNTYNGKPFTLNKCTSLLSQMLENHECILYPTQSIPYLAEFDLSIDVQKKLVTYNEVYKNKMLEVLEHFI
jgi:cellulose biosynthesis protein BcsQ